MSTIDKKLTLRPRMMYDEHLDRYKNRLNVIKRKDGYSTEKKQLKRVIESIELIIDTDNKLPTDKNGFSIN